MSIFIILQSYNKSRIAVSNIFSHPWGNHKSRNSLFWPIISQGKLLLLNKRLNCWSFIIVEKWMLFKICAVMFFVCGVICFLPDVWLTLTCYCYFFLLLDLVYNGAPVWNHKPACSDSTGAVVSGNLRQANQRSSAETSWTYWPIKSEWFMEFIQMREYFFVFILFCFKWLY